VTGAADANGPNRRRGTVKVQSLMLDGARVTLGVYRQIKDEPLIDQDTCQLRGTPLGTVNYHRPDDCPRSGEHLHVVWNKGNDLRRASVTKDWPASGEHSQKVERLARQEQAMYEPVVKLLLLARGQRGIAPSFDGAAMIINVDGRAFRCSDYMLRSDLAALRSQDRSVRAAAEKRIRRERARLLEELVTRAMGTELASAMPSESDLARLVGGNEKNSLFARGVVESVAKATEEVAVLLLKQVLKRPGPAVAAKQSMDRLQAAYDRQYQELAALVQLFIAA